MKAPAADVAERAVLGCVLRDNGTLAEVLPLVGEEDFRTAAGRAVFAALCRLVAAGSRADAVTLAEELHACGEVEKAGGYRYLVELLDVAAVPAGVLHYAEQVRDRSLLRSLCYACDEIKRDALEPHDSAAAVLERAERLVFGLSGRAHGRGPVRLEVAVNEALDRIDARRAGGSAAALPTGLRDLDELLGGLHGGELVVVAARTSVGKSAFALELLRRAVLAGTPAFLASLEMGRAEVAERLLAAGARLDLRWLRDGGLSAGQAASLLAAAGPLRSARCWVDDAASQTAGRVAAHARRLRLREGVGLVVVDYLQLVEPESRRVPRQEQVAEATRRLKTLARELGVPVLALAQLNRGVEEHAGNRPRLSDLRESGAVEQDADAVLLLHRPDYYEPAERPGQVDVIVAKNRNGPTGSLTLYFRRGEQRFEDFERGVTS